MGVPTTTLSLTTPAGSDNIAQGDDRIREAKTQFQEIINVDHECSTTQSASTGGEHKKVTLQDTTDLGTGATGKCFAGAQGAEGSAEFTFTDEDDNDVRITKDGYVDATAMGGVYAAANVAAVATIGSLLMPVGTIYANAAVSTNPATLFGFGTWVAIEGETVVGLVAGGYFDTLGSVSEGAATVKLTGGESGTSAHTHTINSNQAAGGAADTTLYNNQDATQTADVTTDESTEANADDAHNNIQPSYCAYVWRRTV